MHLHRWTLRPRSLRNQIVNYRVNSRFRVERKTATPSINMYVIKVLSSELCEVWFGLNQSSTFLASDSVDLANFHALNMGLWKREFCNPHLVYCNTMAEEECWISLWWIVWRLLPISSRWMFVGSIWSFTLILHIIFMYIFIRNSCDYLANQLQQNFNHSKLIIH